MRLSISFNNSGINIDNLIAVISDGSGDSAAWEMGGKGGKGGSAAWEVMGGKGGPPLGLSPSPDGIWHRCHFFGEDAGCEEWGVM